MKKIKTTKEITQYEDKCPYCDKVIVGSTETQVSFNMGIHIGAKHRKNKFSPFEYSKKQINEIEEEVKNE